MIDSREKSSYFPKSISESQSKDTGLAMVLMCLLFGYLRHYNNLVALSIVLLIIDMIIPNIYKPLAKIWFGISNILGTIMSKLLLTIMFFCLVTPVGIIRRINGADSLQLKSWKKDASSVFAIRDHIFRSEDIEKPY